jgi:hypothetical protein
MASAEQAYKVLESFRWDPMECADSSCPSSEPSETPPEAPCKVCADCQETLPVEAFYVCATYRDGRQKLCKKCFTQAYPRGKKRLQEDGVVCDETEHVIPGPGPGPDALYIMENPRIPGEVKVGRSQSPEERAKQLSAGNNFRLVVRRSYGEKGFLEKTIHQKLKCRRVEEGAGIEWFKVSVEQADLLITAAILEDEISKFSC